MQAAPGRSIYWDVTSSLVLGLPRARLHRRRGGHVPRHGRSHRPALIPHRRPEPKTEPHLGADLKGAGGAGGGKVCGGPPVSHQSPPPPSYPTGTKTHLGSNLKGGGEAGGQSVEAARQSPVTATALIPHGGGGPEPPDWSRDKSASPRSRPHLNSNLKDARDGVISTNQSN